jgi:hypothetical protein
MNNSELLEKLEQLASLCFDAEKNLPAFSTFGENNEYQDIRRKLYCIRIKIGEIENELKRKEV